MSYKKVIVSEFGGPDVLKVVEEENLPTPAAGEIRVKVLTAGTGFTDTIIRQGQYVDNKEKPPFVLGYDWFGVVDALGDGVTKFKVGDYVADLSMIGGYTQYLTINENQAIPAPAGLDSAEAVAMVLSYGTAYQMLKRLQPLPPGSTVLVHAAGGAVGSAVCELARLMGIRLIGTASKSKHDLLTHYSCEPIDYHSEDFVQRTHELTNGEGVDAVLDTIGGAYWKRSYQCLKPGGMLIAFGAYQLTSGEEKLPTLLWGFFKLLIGWKLIPDGKKTAFYNIEKRRKQEPEEFNEDMAELFAWLKSGQLKPTIAECRPLEDAAEVHRQLDKAQIIGKTVLRCNDD